MPESDKAFRTHFAKKKDPLPRKLILNELGMAVTFSWADVQFGIAQGIIGPDFAIDRAVALVEASDDPSDDLLELCGMYPEEEIAPVLTRLAAQEAPTSDEAKLRLWGDLVLHWVYQNRADFDDLQGLLEGLYADFDYPEDWTPFIGYMPQEGPTPWSAEESLRRYLAEAI